jgi:ferric-dicitrate binding protein FerR (iron transport regulator)
VSAPRYARLAGRVLARFAPPVSAAPPSAAARAATIEALDRYLANRARSRRRIRWAAVAAAASLAVTASVGRHLVGHAPAIAPSATLAPAARTSPIVAYPLGAGASTWRGGALELLAEAQPIDTGSRIETPANGRAALAFATGTSAMLGESADLTLGGDAATQILRLDAGSIDLQVAKVSVDHRFLVATPDAEIEVHGTAFRVAIGPPDPACSEDAVTHLVVTEGVVVVRHGGFEKRVASGGHWPSDCGQPAGSDAGAPVSMPSAAVAQALASTLGEQNDLFAEAIVAKHGGDAAGAVAVFDRFLATYPASPLAQSAAVERMRLLRFASPARAVGAARQYLARYPNGFARGEAEGIVGAAR